MAGSGSGTWGNSAKCCKEGTWEARGTAKPKAQVPEGESCSDQGPDPAFRGPGCSSHCC